MNNLIRRIEALHSTKCFKASDFGVAQYSYEKITATRQRIMNAIRTKQGVEEMRLLSAEIRAEWDAFMQVMPTVSEQEIERLIG